MGERFHEIVHTRVGSRVGFIVRDYLNKSKMGAMNILDWVVVFLVFIGALTTTIDALFTTEILGTSFFSTIIKIIILIAAIYLFFIIRKLNSQIPTQQQAQNPAIPR